MPKILTLPELGKHACFLGMTGSGKSELCQHMINAYENVRVFCIDPDDSVELKGGKTVTSPGEAKFWFKIYDKIRYVPKHEYFEREVWEDLFQWLISTSTKKKPNPMIIHINEIYRLGYGANFPVGLPVTMATARKRKISMFIETQRPKAIPIPVLTEASRIFVWILRRLDDRKYIAGYIGGDDVKGFLSVLNNQKKDFSFIEIDGDTGEWTKFPPLKI
jgi:energy-coupling factor transporter ATP-binding protein EcfA2